MSFLRSYFAMKNVLFWFSTQGDILRSEIDGSMHMKSFIPGTPSVRIRLNEYLTIGGASGMTLQSSNGYLAYCRIGLLPKSEGTFSSNNMSKLHCFT